jgi:hypothetical protein
VEKLHERSGTAKATEIAMEYLTVCTALAVLLYIDPAVAAGEAGAASMRFRSDDAT